MKSYVGPDRRRLFLRRFFFDRRKRDEATDLPAVQVLLRHTLSFEDEIPPDDQIV